MFKNQVVVGSLYALCATVLWAGAFIIARLAVGEISPMTLGATRWGMALLILSTFMLPTVKKEWPIAKTFLPQIIAAALFGVAAYSPLSYFAAQTTSAINLSLISVTTPIFIVIIAAGMGQKQSINTWAGCIVALLGSFYLVSGGNIDKILGMQFAAGDILMLAAAVGFAIYSLILKKTPEGLSGGTIMYLMSFFAVLMLIPCVIWESTQPSMVFNMNGIVLLSITFSAICSSIIAWWTWNIGLKKAGPELCGMIYYSLPLWGGVFAYIFLGEQMTSVHYISGALIIGGIVWASRGAKKAPVEIEATPNET
ncbi:Permease of the drug/metabolite transporter (DMT) superfamily [Pseudodesulfovibrio profundus]|uniref:Permease of the drug/metabolite transporter (DMT) superfamily n=1 Tax=Pseudodesulfovibrio profundus TaxID=57320 RepID=A0A2C8F5Y2_9BACT|nr:DMT family transporter [Pseudodesulfovibrio profundus]SOB57910.1 Permease of the drug/metabolite transporter (DMT) superfamily [Pseudodesulfovibrio profundus]